MAFGVEELRVLRRALALALHPSPVSAEDVKDCLRLAESLDEAARESARLRAFLVADLARYRAALPGTAAGYLTLLDEALGAGHHPTPDDLAALGALRGNPAAAALLLRCRAMTEQDVRPRFTAARPQVTIPAPSAPLGPRPRTAPDTAARATPAAPTVPASRTRLLALPGGLSRAASDPAPESEGEPARKPSPRPAPAAPEPDPDTRRRPIPTPGEVFPRRKPAPPPAGPSHQLAAG
ncbi:hypothetical protein TU94_14805 [Streptomyces cyaneogriseus subsp. noncyanogenus]|uniref:Uncharacterized protein n=1 Tax=Streptomyces cyaneogriseus subsp. noncyanogenus TaxID=477245 RepID=A0A0C5GE64_9ACTN|nr:hypothetical protein [Streptomyces cyaneogriseus]AJP02566.1 hypothetical protein TU94_14805 [Streptomyces cyaneogriseus subsp. noncyanogenus]